MNSQAKTPEATGVGTDLIQKKAILGGLTASAIISHSQELVGYRLPVPEIGAYVMDSAGHPILGFASVAIFQKVLQKAPDRFHKYLVPAAVTATVGLNFAVEEAQDIMFNPPAAFYDSLNRNESFRDLAFALGGCAAGLLISKFSVGRDV